MAWSPDPSATLVGRVGASPVELGNTTGTTGCPDFWQLSNGDYAVVGRDLTENYSANLPAGLVISEGERLVVIPRNLITSAKGQLPDE